MLKNNQICKINQCTCQHQVQELIVDYNFWKGKLQNTHFKILIPQSTLVHTCKHAWLLKLFCGNFLVEILHFAKFKCCVNLNILANSDIYNIDLGRLQSRRWSTQIHSMATNAMHGYEMWIKKKNSIRTRSAVDKMEFAMPANDTGMGKYTFILTSSIQFSLLCCNFYKRISIFG